MIDPAKFEAMVRENGPRIYTLAVQLSGNVVDGQDLAQETFIKAYEKWDQFRGDAQPISWLYRICLNLWKNRVRYEKRRSFWKHFSLHRGRNNSDDERPPLEIPAAEELPGTEIERAQEQQLIYRALAQMDAEDRGILTFRDVENRSYEEIAALLQIPLGTVRSRLARSREKLRQFVAQQRIA